MYKHTKTLRVQQSVLQTLQPRRRHDLHGATCPVSSADRCSVPSVRACRGMVCAAACTVYPFRVCWGHPGGIGPEARVGAVSPVTTEKIKKAQKLAAQFCATKNFPPQKQKDPYKGSVFCAILALQALKGRNLQKCMPYLE